MMASTDGKRNEEIVRGIQLQASENQLNSTLPNHQSVNYQVMQAQNYETETNMNHFHPTCTATSGSGNSQTHTGQTRTEEMKGKYPGGNTSTNTRCRQSLRPILLKPIANQSTITLNQEAVVQEDQGNIVITAELVDSLR